MVFCTNENLATLSAANEAKSFVELAANFDKDIFLIRKADSTKDINR
jgi:hypothetical protein